MEEPHNNQKRRLEIEKAAFSATGIIEQSEWFIEGAKWADEHPNKKLVYTKKELLDMGFSFDLNGNISTPQEIEERTKKYINYRKYKWLKKACDWLDNNAEDYTIDGGLSIECLIYSFKKAMEAEG